MPVGFGDFSCCELGHNFCGHTMTCDKQRIRSAMEEMLQAMISRFKSYGFWVWLCPTFCITCFLFCGFWLVDFAFFFWGWKPNCYMVRWLSLGPTAGGKGGQLQRWRESCREDVAAGLIGWFLFQPWVILRWPVMNPTPVVFRDWTHWKNPLFFWPWHISSIHKSGCDCPNKRSLFTEVGLHAGILAERFARKGSLLLPPVIFRDAK